VSPVKCELCFYISEDDILHSYRREHLKYFKVFVIFSVHFMELVQRAGDNSVMQGARFKYWHAT
jgi:hypothetical protein